MNRWITADWHLGENRFGIMQWFQFTTAQEMVDHFVKVHNSLVSPDDIVFFVGDICNLNTPEFLEQVARFHGRKTLFRGNHDRVFTNEQLAPYFDTIFEEDQGLNIDVPDGEGGMIPCYITHYPTQSVPDRFNLVGHIHTAWKVQSNMLNVGVDCNHYYPHNLDMDIPFFFKAICHVYDQDVWVADHAANAPYKETRGKPNRYLDREGLIGG